MIQYYAVFRAIRVLSADFQTQKKHIRTHSLDRYAVICAEGANGTKFYRMGVIICLLSW